MPLARFFTALMLLALSGASGAETTTENPTENPAKSAASPATHVAPLSRSQSQAQALQQQLSSAELLQLSAADETFLALWKPAVQAEASGVLVLIPGTGESADWPLVIAPLRRQLTEFGWSTLSISLPDPLSKPLPAPAQDAASTPPVKEGESATDSPAETAPATEPAKATDQAPLPAYRQQVMARLDAALQAAREKKPARLVLLGHADGAYWATAYLTEKQPDDVSNLLLVAASEPPMATPSLTDMISQLKLASGDFYYQDQPDDRDAARQRLQAGKRQAQPAYLQIAMRRLPGNPEVEATQLLRRIRGWLDLQLRAGPAAPRP